LTKTVRLTLSEIADYANIQTAVYRACRGKWSRSDVARLITAPYDHLSQLQVALSRGELPVGSFQSFTIYDPKKRLIHAAPLLDRIAHHALMNRMEARLERALLPSVFACRFGKGVHAAIYYAQRQSRRYGWVMHADIRSYFPAIQHSALRVQLHKRFKGDGLQLVDAVLEAYQPADGISGRGLPIGALTSQHFANHYLNDIDRWCLSQPGIQAHCRYMDDILLWSNNKDSLLLLQNRLQERLAAKLGLTLKPALVQRTSIGIQFCGIKIKPYSLRASKRRRRRFKVACKRLEQGWHSGFLEPLEMQQGASATLTILLPARETGFRRRFFQNRSVLEV